MTTIPIFLKILLGTQERIEAKAREASVEKD